MAKRSHFPGSSEPLHIFQDENFDAHANFVNAANWQDPSTWTTAASWNTNAAMDSWSNSAPMTSHAPMPAITKAVRKPLGTATQNMTATANPMQTPSLPPPSSSPNMLPPHKNRTSVLQPGPNANRLNGNRLNTIPMVPPQMTHHMPTDSVPKKGPYLSTFKPTHQKSDSGSGQLFDKENVPPYQVGLVPAKGVVGEGYYTNSNGKRGLMDAAPIKDGRTVKKAKASQSKMTAQDNMSSPATSKTKPALSYAQLIALALRSAPGGRCTLAQIYKWISTTYPFYSTDSGGWQNSIRHNLSLHKDFKKMERPKDDPGKGSYWYIEPGAECQFFKDKTARKSVTGGENLPIMSSQFIAVKMTPTPQEPCLPPPAPVSQDSLPPLPLSQVAPEPSSDATEVLLSDDGAEEDAQNTKTQDSVQRGALYTDLPANMHSSPPVPSRMGKFNGTLTPTRYRRHSSAKQSKRDFASMEDSGYISSLESSVLRPTDRSMNSDLNTRPRRKMARFEMSGRAEDEIARLRSSPRSSPFSPSKGRSKSAAFTAIASSPLRPPREVMAAPPLTPAVKPKPPVSQLSMVSPGTELTLHRNVYMKILGHHHYTAEDYESGIHHDETFFHLGDTPDVHKYREYDCPIISNDFELGQDTTGFEGTPLGMIEFGRSVLNGSPVKRSTAQRLGLQRVASTPNMRFPPMVQSAQASPSWRSRLGNDGTQKVFSTAPNWQLSPVKITSPTKGDGLMASPRPPLTPDVSQFLSPSLFAPTEPVSGGDITPESVDILKGFQRIGSANGSGSQTMKRVKTFKPNLPPFNKR